MQTPASIGKYELLEFLGGGMSDVYRGRDTAIDRPVAIKLLGIQACSDAEAKARFLQEARVAGNIQHENIVSVFDFGEHEGRPYIVMEYLKGGDLKAAIRDGRAGTLQDRLRIALQLAEALNYVHARGIIHRDIKPENVNLDPSGHVKLMDFGIAKTPELALTRTGMAMGTPFYMAPEQVSGKPAAALVDVYGFGMVLFELLTGKRGVTGDTIEAVFYQILNQPLDITAMENVGVPPSVRDLVMRCTAKNEIDRPLGFAQIVAALRGILSSAERDKTQPVSVARPIIRLSLVTYGLVALVTVIAIIAWIHVRPPEQIPGMVYIPAGTFPSGEDKHPVTLKMPFYIDETEVTNREFASFCSGVGKAIGCVAPTAADDLPVVNVSYAMARAYAKSFRKRLPTPLEWERAARGTHGALFPWGDAADPTRANLLDNPTIPVKRLLPARSLSPYLGVYQMVGNAWEMVEGEVAPSAAAVTRYVSLLDPPATAQEPWISIRGGAFNTPLTPGVVYDSATIPERYTASNIGFRCVQDP